MLYHSQSACDIYAYIGLLQLTSAGGGAYSPVQKYPPINVWFQINHSKLFQDN